MRRPLNPMASRDWLRRGMRIFDASIAILLAVLTLTVHPGLYYLFTLEYLLMILLGSLLLPAMGEMLGLYQPWRGRSLYTMLGVYLLSWASTLAILSLLIVATQSTHYFSRLWMGSAALGVLLSGMLLRTLLYTYLRRLRAAGQNLKRVMLVGCPQNVQRLEKRLNAMSYTGYIISHTYAETDQQETQAHIERLVHTSAFQRDFDEIWLSYPLTQGNHVRDLTSRLVTLPVNIRYFPDLSDVRLLNHRMAQVAGMYSLELNYSPLNGPMRFLKALEDRLLGLMLFIIFLPVMLVLAAVIRYKMGGPVLFKQYRHGLDGKRFRIYKFRTMSLHHADHTQQAKYGDPRITPLGAFMRRTSLDELPQLYNVLQGRMSLVGPRPHAMDHNEYYKDVIEDYMQRHRVKPGMTGWAQVHGWRGQTESLDDMKKRVEYDLYYIDNWTLGLDLKILAMTLTHGFVNRQP